ncbi:conserved hypothetical protein [Sporisorium reilianum SRZ2]|uniref:Uncharacterized protein n=1 Tax=Sporisorium reilianum (strain SRZ2) TaxID=999809 RepID=E6ZSE2_SPORE|nr:conserved hypothetical protein [Sporisorium reilianum SRZ2]
MNFARQQQQPGDASHSGTHPTAPPVSWEGDQMLHIYVCDYLRKRGYSQAALALRLEAGLEPDRRVPIDAPQSLLFEWWVVFWEVFASRSLDKSAAANGGISADAQMYTTLRPPGLPEARSATASQPVLQNSQAGAAAPTTAQQPTLTRRMSQAPPNDRSEPSSSTRASPPDQQGGVQPRRLSASTLPQLDLEASHRLGLARPASRVVIQQCMDMMNLSAKEIEHLTAEETRALAKRVTCLQKAQNDAQVRLARLHGLQPPKPLVPGSMAVQARMQHEAAGADGYNNQAGQKRKDSPNSDADRSRIATAGPSAPTQEHRPMQPQLSTAPSMRRPSYPALPSPLTPSNAAATFSQVSPHPMMQHSPASSAPTPSTHAMNPPPTRRPSVFGEPTSLPGSSPHKAGVYASGLAGSSASPMSDWPGLELTPSHAQQMYVPPLQQQQRPVVMPSSLDASASLQHRRAAFPAPTLSGVASAPARAPLAQHVGGKDASAALFQLDLPPHLAKPSVFGSAGGDADGTEAYATAAALNGFLMQQPQLAEGSAPPTPFADLEYDFNVLLSNSTQLSRGLGGAL